MTWSKMLIKTTLRFFSKVLLFDFYRLIWHTPFPCLESSGVFCLYCTKHEIIVLNALFFIAAWNWVTFWNIFVRWWRPELTYKKQMGASICMRRNPYLVYVKMSTAVTNWYFVFNAPVLSMNTACVHFSDGKLEAEGLFV